jgi:Skp family chaperone for outer membrane proteins
MEQALGQILQQVVTQHGANMVLDKQAVLYAIPGNNFDVTADAIKLLDQKLPSVKVTLAPLPPGVQLQQ